MNALNKQDVDHIALLARLALSDEEKLSYLDDLMSVLTYAEKLNELDLDNVKPTAHAVAQQNVIRADEINSTLTPEKALANAAEAEDDQFVIQAVFD